MCNYYSEQSSKDYTKHQQIQMKSKTQDYLKSPKSSLLDTVLHQDTMIMSQNGCYLKAFETSYGFLFLGLLGDIHIETYQLSSSSNGVYDGQYSEGDILQMDHEVTNT
jgi:hypothetical protein